MFIITCATTIAKKTHDGNNCNTLNAHTCVGITMQNIPNAIHNVCIVFALCTNACAVGSAMIMESSVENNACASEVRQIRKVTIIIIYF